jgi:penicillin amidase
MIVLPGWTDEYDWKGMVPFDQLPNEYNPARGYISSANARQVSGSYPYHIGTWYDMPYRLDRIRELLDSKEKFAISDFRLMQNDQHSTLSSLFLNTMFRVTEGYHGWDQTEKTALEKLKSWNFDLNTKSPEAAISECWMYCFTAATYEDELGDNLYSKFTKVSSVNRNAMYNLLKKGSSAWIDNISTEANETLTDIAVQSLKNAVDTLKRLMGNDINTWEWGKIT